MEGRGAEIVNAYSRIVFLGNHTVGVRTLRVLADQANLVGVVAHPKDAEDGIRYESVYVAAKEMDIPVIRTVGRSLELVRFIAEIKPDLIWITDYRYILPDHVLDLSKSGAVNLHPSILPKYRGRAPINWAILHGESTLGLTAHWVDAGIDTGDIILQRVFNLRQDQDVGDALRLFYPLYESMTKEVLQAFRAGNVPRRKQLDSEATVFPARSPKDGAIDWRRSALEVWNLVRAVAHPYPGAFARLPEGILRVHRVSEIVPLPQNTTFEPGSIVGGSLEGGPILISCSDAYLLITDYSFESCSEPV